MVAQAQAWPVTSPPRGGGAAGMGPMGQGPAPSPGLHPPTHVARPAPHQTALSLLLACPSPLPELSPKRRGAPLAFSPKGGAGSLQGHNPWWVSPPCPAVRWASSAWHQPLVGLQGDSWQPHPQTPGQASQGDPSPGCQSTDALGSGGSSPAHVGVSGTHAHRTLHRLGC